MLHAPLNPPILLPLTAPLEETGLPTARTEGLTLSFCGAKSSP